MELGIQREESLAAHSSSGPLRRQLGPFSSGNSAARSCRVNGEVRNIRRASAAPLCHHLIKKKKKKC